MTAMMNEARESMAREREQFEASLKEAASKSREEQEEREERRKQDESARNAPPVQQQHTQMPVQSHQQPVQCGFAQSSSCLPLSFQPVSAPYSSMQMPYAVASVQQPFMPYSYMPQQSQQQMGNFFSGQPLVNSGSYQWNNPTNGFYMPSQSYCSPHQFYSVPCPTNRVSGLGMGSQ